MEDFLTHSYITSFADVLFLDITDFLVETCSHCSAGRKCCNLKQHGKRNYLRKDYLKLFSKKISWHRVYHNFQERLQKTPEITGANVVDFQLLHENHFSWSFIEFHMQLLTQIMETIYSQKCLENGGSIFNFLKSINH